MEVTSDYFGAVPVSGIILGTMRWADKGLSAGDARSLIRSCLEAGIDTHHISPEYKSFGLYKEAMGQLSPGERNSIKVISKFSAPGFKEERFDEKAAQQRLEKLMTDLGVENIPILQWMDRWDQLDEEKDRLRIQRLKNDHGRVKQFFEKNQKQGLVTEFACFPYTPPFADAVKDIGLTNRFICYYNRAERDYEHLISPGNFFIALRPFFAGKLLKSFTPSELVEFALKKNVQGAVVGINSEQQLNELVYADAENLQRH